MTVRVEPYRGWQHKSQIGQTFSPLLASTRAFYLTFALPHATVTRQKMDSLGDTSAASSTSDSPDTVTAVTTPATSEAEVEITDKDGNTLVTDAMLKEEEKMQEETEKETAKVMQEEARKQYDQVIKEQRMKRLHFLLSKSSAYATILSEKLKRQQDEARDKAARLDAAKKAEEAMNKVDGETETKRVANDEQEQDDGGMATRRRSGRTGSVTSAPAKKARVTAKKRKIGDEEYQLGDLINEEVRSLRPPSSLSPRSAEHFMHILFNLPIIFPYLQEIKRRKQDSPDPTVSSSSSSFSASIIIPTAAVQPAVDPTKKIKASISARQPALVTGGVLREYQLAGVEWLVSLWENGLNGILADEMGLGKTLQTISFIAHLKGMNVSGPFLIVTPLSTLANWVSEFQRYLLFVLFIYYFHTYSYPHHLGVPLPNTVSPRFSPTIPVLLYHGSKEERVHMVNHKLKKNKETTYDFPIVVTSYEIVMNDRKYLQNNLAELWSLLNFLLPDIFDDLDMFQSWFDFSDLHQKSGQERIMREEDENHIVSSLHMILKPFLLRRLKNDGRLWRVFVDMVVKKELYDAILKKNIRGFLISKKSGAENTAGVSENGKESEENGEKGSQNKTKKRASAASRVNYKEMTDAQWFKLMDSEIEPVEEEEEEEKEGEQNQKKNEAQAVDNEAVGREFERKNAIKAVSNLKLQNLVMQLRKACNHPFLFDWPVDPITNEPTVSQELVNQSGKILLLNRLLPALFERGHKVLIFSQMTKMLDILQDWISLIKGWKTCRLDGSVAQEERRKQIAEFNDPKSDCMLFLLSTRAGGLGINLTAADTVVIFDSDWVGHLF
ncbi:P-loop containing nucleoside triphosphate hydrolase protein [Endogone sp. FLAS-F59071]|nr:P-loop containing nucleoside triphosphate hydrolase protein [Endogone sp. FLAS-F59071]|eukprot:RUS14768.1 P-loop containing nucleoside triphosphate hydrolase protein [Endogone sp. FLAS-F59071]